MRYSNNRKNLKLPPGNKEHCIFSAGLMLLTSVEFFSSISSDAKNMVFRLI